MKTTLVIDTDDLDGLKDSFKIVKMMNDKYNTPARAYNDRSFGKLKFIKLLRAFVKSTDLEDPQPLGSLRVAKQFADSVWAGDLD